MNFSEFDQVECDHEVRCLVDLAGTVWTAQGDGAIHLRDASTTHVRFTIDRFSKEFVWSLVAVPTTDHVWAGYSSGYLRVYDSSGSLVAEMLEHTAGIHCIAHCHHTSSVFTGGNDGIVLEWDVNSFAFFRAYKGHTGPVRCIQVGVAVDSNTSEVQVVLYSGSDDKSVREWAVSTNSNAQKRNGWTEVDVHCGAVLCMTIVERVLWSAGEDAEIRVTELRHPYRTVAVLQNAHERSITALCSVPGTPYLLSGAVDRSVVVWDGHAMTPIRTFPACHKGYIHTIGLAMEEVSRCVTIWSTASDRSIRRWQLQISGPPMVSFNNPPPPQRRSVSGQRSPARSEFGGQQSAPALRDQQNMQDIINGYKREIWCLRNKEATFKQKIIDVQSMIEAAQKQSDVMKSNYNSQVKHLVDSIHKKDERLHRVRFAEKKLKDLVRSFQGRDAFLTNQLEQILELLSDENEGVLQAADLRSARVGRKSSPVTIRRTQSPRAVTSSPRGKSPPNTKFFERQEQAFRPASPSPVPQQIRNTILPATPTRGYSPAPLPTSPRPHMSVPQRSDHVSPGRTTIIEPQLAAPNPLIIRKLPVAPTPQPSADVTFKNIPPSDPNRKYTAAPSPAATISPKDSVEANRKYAAATSPTVETPRDIVAGMTSPDRMAVLKARIKTPEPPQDVPVNTPAKPNNSGPTPVKQAQPSAAKGDDSLDRVQVEYQRILARLEAMEKDC